MISYISKVQSYLYSNLYDWVCINTVDQFTNDQKENIINFNYYQTIGRRMKEIFQADIRCREGTSTMMWFILLFKEAVHPSHTSAETL